MFPCATEPTRSSLKFAFLSLATDFLFLYTAAQAKESQLMMNYGRFIFFNIVCSPRSSIEVAAVNGWPDPHLLSPNADTFYEPDS